MRRLSACFNEFSIRFRLAGLWPNLRCVGSGVGPEVRLIGDVIKGAVERHGGDAEGT